MSTPVPSNPKIYHIVHVDRLTSIIADDFLFCDADIAQRSPDSTTIGMDAIKHRRLHELRLSSHPDIYVGQCVPFYFCPRSVMLYVIYQANHADLAYRGGQDPIVHLEADLRQTVCWAQKHDLRWAFTLSNAGAYYFEDRCDLNDLPEVDWNAVQANQWRGCKEGKQAEFLIEQRFPWELVARIGVRSQQTYQKAMTAVAPTVHRPRIEVRRDWYY